MFDRLVETRQTRRPWKAAFLVVSVVGHVVGVTALLITAMWQISELAPPKSRPIVIQATKVLAPPPPATTTPRITHPIKPKPDVITQPVKVPEDQEEDVQIGIDGDDLGDPNGVPGGVPGGDGDCYDCIAITPAMPEMTAIKAPVIEAPKKPVNVQRQRLDGHRIAGNAQIHPPMSVRQQMVRDGVDTVRGIIKMCLDSEGQVTSLKVVQSTGYDDYDRELLGEMKRWQYQPYRLDGEPVPVCTPIDFTYIQR